jgi:hypothetical protein
MDEEKPVNLGLVQPATLGVKFSNDIFLLRSFLEKRNIPYKEEELENTPLGKAIRIKRPTKDYKI